MDKSWTVNPQFIKAGVTLQESHHWRIQVCTRDAHPLLVQFLSF